jgi:hypothetical protein
MPHKDTGWRPNGSAMQYKGDDVWDHAVAPGEVNDGEQDPDRDADDEDE